MKERPQKENQVVRRSPTSNAAELERRSAARKAFVAETQVVELSSGAKLFGRTCDLAIRGCYVDTLTPFPVGTAVGIRLKKKDTTVEARGNVVYQVPGLGMGIAFFDLTPENSATLEKWFVHVDEEGPSFEVSSLTANQVESYERGRQQTPSGQFGELIHMLTRAQQQAQSGQFVELVHILKKKGILTRAEAAGLLQEEIE
jgi:hypothetical protein